MEFKNSRKRGSTLVEVIVAMAITVIVSSIAFAVCNFAIALGNNSSIKHFFIVESQNYVQAYFLGGDDYKTAMNLLTGSEHEFGDDVTINYSNELQITETENAKYTVHLSFGEKFSVECYNENSKLIYQVEA